MAFETEKSKWQRELQCAFHTPAAAEVTLSRVKMVLYRDTDFFFFFDFFLFWLKEKQCSIQGDIIYLQGDINVDICPLALS